MAKFILAAWSKPAEGKADEFGKWYDQTHLADMLKVPGLQTAQRFRLLKAAPSSAHNEPSFCLYEFEADDERQATAIINTLNAQNMPLSDALDVSSVKLAVYQASGPVQTRS